MISENKAKTCTNLFKI